MATFKPSCTGNGQNQEEFPTLCETCLGDNPYVRMMKDKYGKQCKTCSRPYTGFRWCPGSKMRFKKTEICLSCAKSKNVCQTCVLDLEYGLPTQARDTVLRPHNDFPRDACTTLFTADSPKPKSLTQLNRESYVLRRLVRTAPYYKRNRPLVCSFWVKAKCQRGDLCPYRHEKPSDPHDPLTNQNIQNRYYGVKDPVAENILRRATRTAQIITDLRPGHTFT